MNESRTSHLFLYLLAHSLTERQYHLDYKDTRPWPLPSELRHPQPGREILQGSATQWFPIPRLRGAVHQKGMWGASLRVTRGSRGNGGKPRNEEMLGDGGISTRLGFEGWVEL